MPIQLIFADSDSSMMMEFGGFAMSGLSLLGSLFIFLVGLAVLVGICMFVIDITQTKSAVRRNYPVIGRFRTLFSHLGEFFRQYFFALDREEMPFNRAERQWVDHVCEDGSDVVPFGSTKVLSAGTPVFANGLFPKLEDDILPKPDFVIGPQTRKPYMPGSLFNISAMSYGSLSKPAIQALSRGAALSGCYLNTGEGGVSPYHLEGGGDIVYQLGTAKFGACNSDTTLNEDKLRKICENPNIRMMEIKLSQGAKPGKGGILPANKVNAEIAEIRGIEEGKSALSPNRHVDAGTSEELLDLIHKVREASGLPTGIKLCVGQVRPIIDLFQAIKDRGDASAPDYIVIDGGDGGTGAAPLPLIDNTGPRLQKGLDPANKAVRVQNYIKNIIKEVEIIAHACGVDEPRELQREHLLIVQASGRSKPFDQVWDRSRYH